LLLKDNLGQFEKHVLKPLTCTEKYRLCHVTGVKTIGDFVQKLSNDVSLQTNVDSDRKTILERFSALEKLTLERENGDGETYPGYDDFRAGTHAFIEQQQSNIDMRKFRKRAQVLCG
jgi:hypothetical protein